MSKKEIQSLTTKEEISIFISSITEDYGNFEADTMRKLITWLTPPQQIPLIPVKMIPLLTKENQLLLYALTQKQIQALTKEQIKNLSNTHFTKKQTFLRGAFALPMAILNVLDGGEFILSIAARLYIENYQIQALTCQQISWFSSEQLKVFTEKQIGTFDFKQLKAFTEKQNSYFKKEAP